MKALFALFFALLSTPVVAVRLHCASDAETDKLMCYPQGQMRTSTDSKVREVALYQGGPKDVQPSGYSARVFCDDKYVPVIEMRDRSGIVFARNQAATQLGRDFVKLICSHDKTKVDKALDTVKRY